MQTEDEPTGRRAGVARVIERLGQHRDHDLDDDQSGDQTRHPDEPARHPGQRADDRHQNREEEYQVPHDPMRLERLVVRRGVERAARGEEELYDDRQHQHDGETGEDLSHGELLQIGCHDA